jgi:hypothetical protein
VTMKFPLLFLLLLLHSMYLAYCKMRGEREVIPANRQRVLHGNIFDVDVLRHSLSSTPRAPFNTDPFREKADVSGLGISTQRQFRKMKPFKRTGHEEAASEEVAADEPADEAVSDEGAAERAASDDPAASDEEEEVTLHIEPESPVVPEPYLHLFEYSESSSKSSSSSKSKSRSSSASKSKATSKSTSTSKSKGTSKSMMSKSKSVMSSYKSYYKTEHPTVSPTVVTEAPTAAATTAAPVLTDKPTCAPDSGFFPPDVSDFFQASTGDASDLQNELNNALSEIQVPSEFDSQCVRR